MAGSVRKKIIRYDRPKSRTKNVTGEGKPVKKGSRVETGGPVGRRTRRKK